jgi:hypothetical protein
MVTVYSAGSIAAVTVWSRSMRTWHPPVPEQSPPHPTNVFCSPGVTVRVTTVPAGKSAEHLPVKRPTGGASAEQSMPLGLEVSVP